MLLKVGPLPLFIPGLTQGQHLGCNGACCRTGHPKRMLAAPCPSELQVVCQPHFLARRHALQPLASPAPLSPCLARLPPHLQGPIDACAASAASHSKHAPPTHPLPGATPSVLRDAVLLKPGSTPADLFGVLRRPPWQVSTCVAAPPPCVWCAARPGLRSCLRTWLACCVQAAAIAARKCLW